MMRRWAWPAAIAGTLLVSALGAQEPAGDEAVTLAYKFKPAQTQRFRLSTRSDTTLSGEGLPTQISLTTEAKGDYTEKVTATGAKGATIVVTPGTVSRTITGPAGVIVYKIQGGKAVITKDGQPYKPQPAEAKQLQTLASRKSETMSRDTRGKEARLSTTAGADRSASNLLIFPDKPVQVRDSWKMGTRMRPFGVQLSGGTRLPEISYEFTHTLKEVLVKNGKRFAIIETEGNSSQEKVGQVTAFSQGFTGTSRFDLDRGAMVAQEFTLTTHFAVPPKLLGIPAPASITELTLDDITDVKVSEIVAPAKK